MWNLCKKFDNLWVKWVHVHYMKGGNTMDVVTNLSSSWIMKSVLKQKEIISSIQTVWDIMLCSSRFHMKKIYDALIDDHNRVSSLEVPAQEKQCKTQSHPHDMASFSWKTWNKR